MDWKPEIAISLRDAGTAWTDIAEVFGMSPHTVRCRIDPAYHERRMRQVNEARRLPSGVDRRSEAHRGQKVKVEDITARLAEIPLDTRSLTARTFGDPLPGRSALDRLGSMRSGQ